ALREAIHQDGTDGFPLAEIEKRMAARGKALTFPQAEIDELMESLDYGVPATFAALTVLFPHVNTRNHHHVDHVFPTSLLTPTRLRKAGLSVEEIEKVQWFRNSLGNLQLLEGPENISKSNQPPAAWAVAMTRTVLAQRMDLNALPDPLP